MALDLDPLSVQMNYQVGAIYFFDRQYDRAIEQLRATSELDPFFAPSHQLLAATYAQKGMRHEAMAEIEKSSELRQMRLLRASTLQGMGMSSGSLTSRLRKSSKASMTILVFVSCCSVWDSRRQNLRFRL